MKIAIVTGSGGLIGSETVNFLLLRGFKVLGIDNNFRKFFFGKDGDVLKSINLLKKNKNYKHFFLDIRDEKKITGIFNKYNTNVKLIVHCAAQPSHDWAKKNPKLDYEINCTATINLLELFRKFCPKSVFIYTSTNKVYGDNPNKLSLVEKKTRFVCSDRIKYSKYGIDETMSLDNTTHSLFGCSKLAADIYCQEYGKYFGLKIGVFRGGCLTGPGHAGAELHGFLSYLVKCQLSGKKYNIFGYKGKQVRDNIHSSDLIKAFWMFYKKPLKGEVFNIGGGIDSNISIIEASKKIYDLTGKKLKFSIKTEARKGDHLWWISDTRKFKKYFPKWKIKIKIKDILKDIIQSQSKN